MIVIGHLLWDMRNRLNFLCNTRKIGKNGNNKVKLNGLIHSKIVLVKDHVEYEKETRKSDHSNLMLSDTCYGT